MVGLEQISIANNPITFNENHKPCVQKLLKYYNGNTELKVEEKRIITEILLNICEDCSRMGSLPHGAFAACKLREQHPDRDLLISRMRSAKEKYEAKNENVNKKLTEYSPAKYNGKMMNSIWGFYNRYSPHNIKGNEYDLDIPKQLMQQQMSVAPFVIAEELAMAISSSLEWSLREGK